MATPQPLQERVLTLIKHPQFLWWLGHLTLLAHFTLYSVTVITFRSYANYYHRAYLGALVSYGVVVYKSFGVPQFTMEYAQRFFMDENVQYLFLAFYWYSSAPIFVTLIPFATFSTFHTLGYLRTSIIPTFFPVVSVQATNGAASSAPAPSGFSAQISQFIKQWTDQNYGPAMQFVSYVEVVGVMGRLLLGAITFQTSFLAPLVYAHFLRLRYFMSSYTRAAFLDVSARLDKVLLPPSANARIPPIVGKAYTIIKSLVVRYGQSVAQQQPGTR